MRGLADTRRRRYLVVYDYDTGGVWRYLWTASADAIRQKLPEVTVFEHPPVWMSAEQQTEIARRSTYDLDDVMDFARGEASKRWRR